MKLLTIALTLTLSFALGTQAQDPLAGHLVSTQAIFENTEKIALTPEQGEIIRTVAESAHQENLITRQKLQAAHAALSAELAKDPVDESAAHAKLDAVLALESTAKHRYLKLLIDVNGHLTAEQRQQLLPIQNQATNRPDESLETLKQQIEAMRVEDVAWRQIEWKTCLLDAVQTSREQNKPIVLWVFIDRPIDDKRC